MSVRIGRPPVPSEKRLCETTATKLTASQKAQFERLAARHDVTPAYLLRSLAVAAIQHGKPDVEAIASEVLAGN